LESIEKQPYRVGHPVIYWTSVWGWKKKERKSHCESIGRKEKQEI